MHNEPAITYVAHLPDLITETDYDSAHSRKIARIRVTIVGGGIEILGDSPYPELLDALLLALEPKSIEAVPCG